MLYDGKLPPTWGSVVKGYVPTEDPAELWAVTFKLYLVEG